MTAAPPTILAIHGAGMQAGIWSMLLPTLADMPFRALSLPGHGPETAGAGAGLETIEAMAKWLGKRLDEYPAGSVVLLGHSMGALVALEAAAHPAVGAVILMGGAARMPVHPDLLKLAASDPAAGGEMILKWGLNSGNPAVEEFKRFIRSLMQAGAGQSLFRDLAACDLYAAGEERARALQKPLLVICGSQDKLTRAAEGVALADLAPAGESHVIDDCGHMIMVEHPAQAAALIRSFLEEIRAKIH